MSHLVNGVGLLQLYMTLMVKPIFRLENLLNLIKDNPNLTNGYNFKENVLFMYGCRHLKCLYLRSLGQPLDKFSSGDKSCTNHHIFGEKSIYFKSS